jgi:HSP20 family protein
MLFSLVPWKKKSKNRSRELTRRDRHPLTELREEFDALFDRFLSRWTEPFDWDFGPSRFWGLDVEDGDQEMIVRAEAPGFEPSEVDVQVSGNLLTIKAEKKEEKKGKESNGHYEERRHRTFHKSVTLPPGIDPNKIEARYKNGLLEVHVPKSEEAKGKRIPVKT